MPSGPTPHFSLIQFSWSLRGGDSYVGPILPGPLVDFLAALKPDGRGCNVSSGGGGGSSSFRKGSGGDGGKGSGGNGGHVASKTSKVGVYGGGSRMRVYYNVHIPALSLWNNKN